MSLLISLATILLAQATPEAIPYDPRIQQIPYVPDQIITIGISPGYAAVVEIAPDERVENVVVGNTAAWQVTTNRLGDRVIVKPLDGAIPTNMIVLTERRSYVFMLDPYSSYDQASFIMRFSYPDDKQKSEAAAATATYDYQGSRALFPSAMSDDGERTFITWSEEASLPAVFAMGKDKDEQLVNGRMIGKDFVIQGTAGRYKFRYGNAEATATRRAQ